MTIVKKVFTTSLDFFKPSEIYSPDIQSIIMAKLVERYVNKCYQSMLITKIVRIIKYLELHLVSTRLDGAAYSDVQFEAEGIILIKGEIIHGCKVVDISTSSSILFEHKYVGGIVQPDPKKQVSKIIKKDQIIPVVVQSTRYNPNQSQITVRGTLYVPVVEQNTFYNITEVLSPGETEKLSILQDELNDELKLHSDMYESKNYEFFKELLYPYKTTQKFTMSSTGKKFAVLDPTLENLLQIHSGCIVSPYEAYKDAKLPFYYSKDDMPYVENMTIINSTMYAAMLDIIEKRLLYLRNLRGFAEHYNTPEKNEGMMTYWRICHNVKE
jgi:hypothetical protein